VTTEDKTAEIVGTLASFVAKGIHGLMAVPAKENRQPFYFSFDPSKHCDVDFVTAQLQQRGVGLKVSADTKGNILDAEKVKQMAPELGRSGLVFRPASVYSIQLTYPVDVGTGEEPAKGCPVIIKDTEQFILPDRTKLFVMKYDRMAFVKKVREVGFGDGMLTDFHQKRPSPILGFLGIPKAILQAMVPIPSVPPPSGSASASGTTGSQ
jgi:formylmethanofuran dehydrogenase subunit D